MVRTVRVEVRDNLLPNNTFGMIVEAGFPALGTRRHNDISLVMRGNVFTGSCQNDMLVTLSRHTTGLGLASGPYLLNSTYTLKLGGDIAWDNVWYSHPTGYGNVLEVDGVAIGNGQRTFYDAARTCP